MKCTALFCGLVLGVAFSGLAFAASGPTSILNASYDVSREVFAELNPIFAKQWKAQTGQVVTINQSHAGSSSQARSVLEGLKADVVTFNQVPDVQTLYDKGGLIAGDWQNKFAYKSSPFYSLPVFLVRKGNPKNIRNWNDLVKPGVAVIFPNPKTSGNGRYTYLAAVAYGLDAYKGDRAKAQSFAKALFAHVPVFDTGGRGATTTFADRGIGDVLITFEAEAYGIAKEKGADKFEVVTPPISLLAEFPVAVVNRVVDRRGSRNLATAYLKFLYTPDAQDVIARHFYRVRDKKIEAKYAKQFAPVKLMTAQGAFGGWAKIAKDHFGADGLLDQAFLKE
ncbi:MAG TPA: sulfate ABC transporter substrate-binding protein [Rhizomicrobium sp.]|nr:sulfate ABC transporter substrate-binding protein [Rhizomicrobium sp.]